MIYNVDEIFDVFLLGLRTLCYVLTGKACVIKQECTLAFNHFMVLAHSVAFDNDFRSRVFDTILLPYIYLYVVIIIHTDLKMLITFILDIIILLLFTF